MKIISATNRELDNRHRRVAFREDLYSRIARPAVRVPSLAERREDIPLLVAHGLEQAPALEWPSRWMSMRVLHAMMRRPWSFNIRHLLDFIDEIKGIPADARHDEVAFVQELVATYLDPSEPSTTRSPPSPLEEQDTPWPAKTAGPDSVDDLAAAVRELIALAGQNGRSAPRSVAAVASPRREQGPGSRDIVPAGRLSMADSIAVVLKMIAQSGRVTQAEVGARLQVTARRAQQILGEAQRRKLIVQERAGSAIYYSRGTESV